MNLAIWLIVIGLVAAGSFIGGRGVGVNYQKVADQKQFDQVNRQLDDNKTEASALLKKANADNLTTMIERDNLKTNLEKAHAANEIATNTIRTQFTNTELRFAAQARECGAGGSSSSPSSGNPPSPAGSTIVQLPTKITTDLRQLTLEADRLVDAYKLCFGYAQGVH